MGPRTVAVLFVLCLLLTGYVYLFEREHRLPWEGRVGPVFPRLEYADIVEIELRPGPGSQSAVARADPILLKRKKEGDQPGWWIEKPPVPAHIPRVESIAYSLVDLQDISDVPPSEAARVFDERGPENTIRFQTASGETHRLEVGRDHPDPSYELTYLRLDGQRLFLARRFFRLNLQSKLDDLRSRGLFPVGKARAAKLEVAGDPRYQKVVHRQGRSDDWRFDAPEPAPASREAMGQVLEELNAWRAESFVRDEEGDLAGFGLDHPRTTIAVTDLEGRRTALEIGGPAPVKGQVYVRWSGKPFIMTARAAPAEELERPAENLYSLFVLQVGAEEVVELGIREPRGGEGGEFTLRRAAAETAKPAGAPLPAATAEVEPPRWTVEPAGSGGFEGDPDRIRTLVDVLGSLKVKRYLPQEGGQPSKETGLAEPLLKLEVRTDAGSRWSLAFGRPAAPPAAPGQPSPEEPPADLFNISVKGEPFVFQVVTRLPGELLKNPLYYKNARISGLSADELSEFELIGRSGNEERVWTVGRPVESWALWTDGPVRLKPKKSLEEIKVTRVMNTLARDAFRVEEWKPGEKDLAAREIADDHYRLRLTFTRFKEGHEHKGFTRFYLGAPSEGGGGTWARVNAPDLKELPFLVNSGVAKLLLDLHEHLDDITEVAR
jgi:hypothetical protein